jgi:hypothetical protein
MSSSNNSLGRTRSLAFALITLFAGINLFAAAPTPFPPPQPAGPLFEERRFGPLPEPTATPSPRKLEEDAKPIPRGWIIGGAITAALVVVGILYGSARAWYSANIFDQQYRFPVNDKPALRFGGHRSGGHSAAINLDGRSERKRATASKTENA